METGSEHFAFHYGGLSQSFTLITFTGEKILNNIDVILRRKAKWEN